MGRILFLFVRTRGWRFGVQREVIGVVLDGGDGLGSWAKRLNLYIPRVEKCGVDKRCCEVGEFDSPLNP